jgi:hypothetical protein
VEGSPILCSHRAFKLESVNQGLSLSLCHTVHRIYSPTRHHGRYGISIFLRRRFVFLFADDITTQGTPERVENIVLAEIIDCLSSDKAFSKSEFFREQSHACRILRITHTPPVSFTAITELFSIDKDIIPKHWQNFNAQEKALRVWRRPIVLTTAEVNQIVNVILNRSQSQSSTGSRHCSTIVCPTSEQAPQRQSWTIRYPSPISRGSSQKSSKIQIQT